LSVEKCARGNSGWELTRPHAEGGIVYLLLLHDPSLGLGIGSVWQFSCPEMSMQYSHFRKINPCPLVPEQVIGALEKELPEITSVRFGYWTHMQQLPVNE
jgi:hypothetical protein